MSLRLLRSRSAWVSALALGLAACTETTAADTALDEPRGDAPIPGAEILYVGESPLTLAPGERARLPFAVRPRGQHEVRFALIGDSGDASLDVGSAASDADGNVSVELTAPSTSRTFIVRATLSLGASAEAPVSVSGLGFGAIEVVPSYSGKRTLTRITGTVTTGTSCADLVGIPPPDGPLVAHAIHPRSPIVEGAPVGPALVVTARAGQFAGGCMEVKGLRNGETKSVTVPLLDRPLEFRQPIAVRFELDMSTDDVLAWLETAGRNAAAAFAGQNEVASLLDAMADALPAEHRTPFDEAREARGWDAALSGHFAEASVSLLATAEKLLLETAQWLPLSAGLAGSIGPSSADAATFELQSIFELSTSTSVPFTFSASADDIVHLGGELSFLPLHLLAEAALETARAQAPSADTIPSALAELIGCEVLPEVLLGDEPALGECDAACLVDACTEALATRWEAAMKDETPAKWKLTASGDAQVGNEAELRGIDGSWVGSIEHGGHAISVKGSTRGGP